MLASYSCIQQTVKVASNQDEDLYVEYTFYVALNTNATVLYMSYCCVKCYSEVVAL